MLTVPLNFVFTLCLLAWLAFLTTVVLLAILVAVEMGRMSAQALLHNFRSFLDHAAWRERLRNSDAQFIRAIGIKR